MGKKKTTPAAVQKARRPGKVAQTLKNKAAKRAKHAKLHPKDAQVRQAKTTERKAPMAKGNFPDAKTRYHDGAGRKVASPSFQPTYGITNKAK